MPARALVFSWLHNFMYGGERDVRSGLSRKTFGSNAIYMMFCRHLWTRSDQSCPPLSYLTETPLTADHDASTDMMPIERHASKSKKRKGEKQVRECHHSPDRPSCHARCSTTTSQVLKIAFHHRVVSLTSIVAYLCSSYAPFCKTYVSESRTHLACSFSNPSSRRNCIKFNQHSQSSQRKASLPS